MHDFNVISGRMADTARYISVPLRWFEQHPSRERREFWLATVEGEVHLTVHSRLLPARNGHLVDALVAGRLVVGLANLTTGTSINFLRVDPPLIWRRGHALVLAGLLLGVLCTALAGAVLVSMAFAAAAGIAMPAAALYRFGIRRSLQACVDAQLARSMRGRDLAQKLRRIK